MTKEELKKFSDDLSEFSDNEFEKQSKSDKTDSELDRLKTIHIPLKAPTCGRIVHYFPNGEDKTIHVEKCPAIVLCDNDTCPELFVMWRGGGSVRLSIPHKSAKVPGMAYWDWPEIK